ncbi:hypothetical protein M0R45_002243 [Rubus argutus]|uniref:Uncharacterized protein n=1 Tax=Rubus argutus TaxID=59490 RepID=A0AAW1VJY0_RUBAR
MPLFPSQRRNQPPPPPHIDGDSSRAQTRVCSALCPRLTYPVAVFTATASNLPSRFSPSPITTPPSLEACGGYGFTKLPPASITSKQPPAITRNSQRSQFTVSKFTEPKLDASLIICNAAVIKLISSIQSPAPRRRIDVPSVTNHRCRGRSSASLLSPCLTTSMNPFSSPHRFSLCCAMPESHPRRRRSRITITALFKSPTAQPAANQAVATPPNSSHREDQPFPCSRRRRRQPSPQPLPPLCPGRSCLDSSPCPSHAESSRRRSEPLILTITASLSAVNCRRRRSPPSSHLQSLTVSLWPLCVHEEENEIEEEHVRNRVEKSKGLK